MPGEFEFIDWIRSQRGTDPKLVVPIGDDLAAMKWAADDLLLVGADQILDGVHFDSAVHAPRAIGAKAMNRNLSDCAAMACLPSAAVVTVALPIGTPIDYAKELYLGLAEAGARFHCPIVGGDTGTWNGRLALSVSILGRSAGVKPVQRNGARPGDLIYVSGPLGASILGRHMSFVPKVALGRMLGEGPVRPTAMIDLSDGLSRDMRHICRESNVGATLFVDRIPIHDEAIEMRRDGHSPLEHALHDGEDYELLFTIPQELNINTLSAIGTVSADPGIYLQHADGRRELLEPKAWEHRF